MSTGIGSTLADLLVGCLDALDVESVNRVEEALNSTFVLGAGDLDQYLEGGRPKVETIAILRVKLIFFAKDPVSTASGLHPSKRETTTSLLMRLQCIYKSLWLQVSSARFRGSASG